MNITEDTFMDDRILRMPEVEHLTGLSRSTIYRLLKKEAFPRQARIGFRAVGWRRRDLVSWLDDSANGPQA